MNNKKIIRNYIFMFILGAIICGATIVIADTINSNVVLYDNGNSNVSYDNVQDVLDHVYNIIDHNSTSFSLLIRSSSDLSTELIDGLYRYQGVHDNNHDVDNYICFGTTNKNDCTTNANTYMYRIIGINQDGQMKLLKKVPLTDTYLWNTYTGTDWPNGTLYAGLNGEYFLTNTDLVPSGWENRIAIADWHYYNSTDSTVSTIAERELASPSVSAKIGLMYLHDIADSLVVHSYDNSSWIKQDNDGTEWCIALFGFNKLRVDGGVIAYDTTGGYYANNSFKVRPSFYLTSTQRIASGNGTLEDPYILS